MKIVSIVGARPQFIKAATVSRKLRAIPSIKEILLHTGQHYDENMSGIFFRELDIPLPDFNLGIGSGSHGLQTGLMLKGIEDILFMEKPDIVLVYGDTNSTMAGALAASKLNIPVAHVEAGLRSFNRTMPEEINRIVTDHISGLLFAPTVTAMQNLATEGLQEAAFFSGDVMYDSVLYYSAKIASSPHEFSIPGLPSPYFLATIHRAENTDDPLKLRRIFSAFQRLPHPVVIPLHPRTKKILETTSIPTANTRIIEPVGYLPMMKLTLDSLKVLTDSGGLQKEAYFLGRPCITLRTETEWVETLHDTWNTITGTDPDGILHAAMLPSPSAPRRSAFGDGRSAETISATLANLKGI